jgi:Uma2 family endonuclease
MHPGYIRDMRAVFLEAPLEYLEDRRRKGLDRRDEVWDGVIHVVPPAGSRHNLTSRSLLLALLPVAQRLGLEILYETGVFDPPKGNKNFRVPDLVVVAPPKLSDRGIEGRAELVIEILSPNDESRDKLPFYARVGVREVWLVHPITRAVEVFALVGDRMDPVVPEGGAIRSGLGVVLETATGVLRIHDGATVHAI